MARRLRREQLSFQSGELADGLERRFDLPRARAGVRYGTNCTLSSSGAIRSRPPLRALTNWIVGLTEGTDLDMFVMPYVGSDGEHHILYASNEYNEGTTALSRAYVRSFNDDGIGGYSSVSALGYLDLADSTLVLNNRVMSAAQGAGSIVFCGREVLPQIYNKNEATADDISTIQFYRECPFEIMLTRGSAVGTLTTKQNYTGDPRTQFRIGDTIRLAGSDYVVSDIGDLTKDTNKFDTITLTAVWDRDDCILRPARKWPLSNNLVWSGDAINDLGATETFNPSLCGFYKGRLVFAATESYATDAKLYQPTGVWMSSTYDPFVIMPAESYLTADTAGGVAVGGVPANAPINVEFNTEAGDRFRWMISGERLYFGTKTGVYVVTHSENGPMGGDIGIQRVLDVGTLNMVPSQRDGVPIFASTEGRVYGARYEFGSDAYTAFDAMDMAHHLQSTTITSAAYIRPSADDPIGKLIVVKSDGTAMIGHDFEDGFGWTTIDGWLFDYVFSLKGDAVFVCRRNSDADTRVALVTFNHTRSYTGGFDLDFAIAPSNVSGTTWTVGATSPLCGQLCWVVGSVGNGRVPLEQVTPNATTGNFTLATTGASNLIVGKSYIAETSPVMFPAEDERGTSLGRRYRLLTVGMRVSDTAQVRVDGKLMMSNYGNIGGNPLPEVSGYIERRFLGWKKDPEVVIENQQPYPFDIELIVQEVAI